MSDDYYALLELSRKASAEEIRTAIREQRRVWVRRQSSPDPDRRVLAEQRVRDLDTAEKVLLDAASRAEYDRRLGRTGGPRGAVPGGVPDSGRHRPPTPRRTPASAGAQSSGSAPGSGHGQAGTSSTTGSAQPSGRSTDPEAAHQRARNLLAAEQYRQAAAEYEAVLATDPQDGRARAGLAECYLHTDRVEEGLATLKQLVESDPDDQDLRFTYAYGLYQQAWDGLAEVSDGRLAMSRRQVGLLRRNERGIRALNLDDPQVEGWRTQLESMLRDATRRRKLPSYRKRYYVGAAVVALVLALAGPSQFIQVVGALFLVLIGWVYVQRHRPPMWQVRRKQMRRQTLQRGI